MVLCDLYLKRFDLTKGLFFDTFSITVWYNLCRYDHSVLELESFSPPMNWQTQQETSNQTHPGLSKNVIKKMRRRPDLNMKQNAPQAILIKQNAPQARFFDAVSMGTQSYLYSM